MGKHLTHASGGDKHILHATGSDKHLADDPNCDDIDPPWDDGCLRDGPSAFQEPCHEGRGNNAMVCHGEDTIPCVWDITVSGVQVNTDYCEQQERCQRIVFDPHTFGGLTVGELNCRTCGFAGEQSNTSRPVVDINGPYFVDLRFPDEASVSRISESEGCYRTPSLKQLYRYGTGGYDASHQPICNEVYGVEHDTSNWHLYAYIIAQNCSGGWGKQASEDDLETFPLGLTWLDQQAGKPGIPLAPNEFTYPEGLKLYLEWQADSESMCGPNSFWNDPYNYFDEACGWNSSNVFAGVSGAFQCRGTTVFGNQIHSGSPYAVPNWNRDAREPDSSLYHARPYIVPYYYGGTVTISPTPLGDYP